LIVFTGSGEPPYYGSYYWAMATGSSNEYKEFLERAECTNKVEALDGT